FHYRAEWVPLSSTHRPRVFAVRTSIRGRRPVCLRDCACIRQNQSQPVHLVIRIPEKHHATVPGPGWFAMDRLWESHCQRGGADDGHSNHADCDHVCFAVPHGRGGGGLCCVPQRDELDRHDGGFHR